MTNTLKIPGKIVGINSLFTEGYPSTMYISTETAVYRMDDDRESSLCKVLDITDYQDKPTEKELKEKKKERDNRRALLNGCVNGVLAWSAGEIDPDEDIQGKVNVAIAAVAELNNMDEREEGKS